MTDYYASTAVPEGTTTAGTSIGDPTNPRHAITTLANSPGDNVFVDGSGAPFQFNTANGPIATSAAGTAAAPISVIGYTTTPAQQFGRAELRVDDSGTTDGIDVNHRYWKFRNLHVRQARNGITAAGNNYSQIEIGNCDFEDCGVRGIDLNAETNVSNYIYSCIVRGGCSTAGIECGGRSTSLANCRVIGVTGDGYRVGQSNYGSSVFNCLAHAAGGNGFAVGAHGILMVHSVANRCTGNGVNITGLTGAFTLLNCGLVNNELSAGANQIVASVANTPVFLQNLGGYASIGEDSVLLLGSPGVVLTDPLFTDENPATALDVDLTLQDASPWKGAGLQVQDGVDAPDIGLIFPTGTSGGGGSPTSTRTTVVINA